MQCKECGEVAKDNTLRYCENCGAKMPPLPPGTPRKTGVRPAIPTTGRPRAYVPARDALPDDDTEEQSRSPHFVPSSAQDEHTDPGISATPPYDGPAWLAHVAAHSPTVLGLGLLALAMFLAILPFFSGVGPFWSLVVLAGGWVVAARELREAQVRHPLVDWVPESLLQPAVPALFAVLVAALALRMVSLGFTPLLWLGGAGLVGYDQYRKVYAGEQGWSRLFVPRQLLSGLSLVALGGVALCVLSLFLTWVPARSPARHATAAAGPPELRMMDPVPASSDYSFQLPDNAGWDQPMAVTMELLLLAVLGLMALHPEVYRPDWLPFAPLGVVALGIAWAVFCLVTLGFSVGPVLFLVGLVAVGVVSGREAFARAPSVE